MVNAPPIVLTGIYVPPALRSAPVSGRRQRPPTWSEPRGSMLRGLTGTPVCIISADDIGRVPPSDTEFKDVEQVGSCSWIEGEKPAMLVPGMPDLWKAENTGRLGQLRADNEIPGFKRVTNINADKLLPGISTLETIFHSLDSPRSLKDVELITDRNSLRKLYKLFTPNSIHERRPFRINAQLVGNTVLICRWEDKSEVGPQDPNQYCWAQSYHEETCQRQISGIISCSQIVRYTFGGVKMLVRSAVMATLKPVVVSDPPIVTSVTQGDDLLVKVIRDTSETPGPAPLPRLTLKIGGIDVHRAPYPSAPLSSLVENKTRTIKGEMDFVDIYGQLVFARVPNLHVARHRVGDFATLNRLKLGEGKLALIAEGAEAVLGQVAAVLGKMISVTKDLGGVSFVWSGEGSDIGVWKFGGHPPISDAAKEMLTRS